MDATTVAFASGFVEGALTVDGTVAQVRSYVETTFPNGTATDPLYAESREFLLANDAFMTAHCGGGAGGAIKSEHSAATAVDDDDDDDWRQRCVVDS